MVHGPGLQPSRDWPGWVFIILGVIVLLIIGILPNDRDDSDPPNGRSGMLVLTDYKTGCQYLYRGGAIVPRLDRNSKQICL